MNKYLSKTVIVGIIVMLFASVLSAESFMLQGPSSEKPKLTFRFLHPNFKQTDVFSSLSGVYDFSASIPVNSSLNFIASLPVTFSKVESVDSETAIGNLSIGIQKRFNSKEGKNTSVTIGAALPTVSDTKHQSVFTMGYSNLIDLHKIALHTLTLYGTFAHHVITEGGLMYGIEATPTVYIPTKKNELRKTEAYLRYGGLLGYRTKFVDINAEVTGSFIVTEDYDDLSDRFLHMATFGIQYNRGSIRPGLYYSLYMKKPMSDFISGVLGIKLDVIL